MSERSIVGRKSCRGPRKLAFVDCAPPRAPACYRLNSPTERNVPVMIWRGSSGLLAPASLNSPAAFKAASMAGRGSWRCQPPGELSSRSFPLDALSRAARAGISELSASAGTSGRSSIAASHSAVTGLPARPQNLKIWWLERRRAVPRLQRPPTVHSIFAISASPSPTRILSPLLRPNRAFANGAM